MIRRRLAITVAVLASLALTVGACTTASGTANPGAPARSATEILADALAKSKGQSFTYTLTYGAQLTADGAQDAAAGNGTRNVKYTDAASGFVIKATITLVGGALYAKLDLGAAAMLVPGLSTSKWMVLDMKKTGTSGLAAGLVPTLDSSAPEAYLGGVASAETVSPTQLKGTLDLSKSAPKLIPPASIAKLDPSAKIVPFAVTLDDQGRVAKVVLNLPKIETLPAADLTLTYAGYGSTVQITAPVAADTIAAPDLIYNFLQ